LRALIIAACSGALSLWRREPKTKCLRGTLDRIGKNDQRKSNVLLFPPITKIRWEEPTPRRESGEIWRGQKDRCNEMNEHGGTGNRAATSNAKSPMIRAMVRLLVAVGLGAFIVLFALFPLGLRFGVDSPGWPESALMARLGGIWPAFLLEGVVLGGAALIATWALFHLLRGLESVIDANAAAQAHFLDTLDPRYIDVGIAVSAALSLFLELALIRWQSSVLEFLAFYKNFSLLACFAGLGLGYALGSRDRIPLQVVVPLLAAQFCFFLFVRIEFLLVRSESTRFEVNPFREQMAMGMSPGNWVDALGLFVLLSVIFLLTALTFVPIGQLCGRLMERRKNLRAYGLNLIGSVLGVVMMLVASLLWTPPLVWFAMSFLGVLLFHFRQPSPLVVGVVFSIVCTIILAWWPLGPLWSRVYSPYQLIEIGTDSTTGLTLIRASGHYYQHILDLSDHRPESSHDRDFYDFPYKAHPILTSVAVIGSGTGNDVAAAVRAGAGRVDAIEIDPVILLVGEERHPEKPYTNPRVRPINNDARSFFRGTADKYDLIVYGMLDSHTLLSQGSSVRLDSFVYTVEGLREARNLLKPDGMISLSFTVLSEALGRKIYLMLQQVFDGRSPLCVSSESWNTTFLISNDPNWRPPANLMGANIKNVTTTYANSSIRTSVSTDDWPFFYMPQRIYPVSYLIMIALILVLSLLLVGNFVAETPRLGHLSFFFLGIGFMLVETKGITEMGLVFGNTWQVVGVVFVGILIMAFLGNCLVQWLGIKRSAIVYLFLFAALAAGWLSARSGGFASTPIGRLETVALLSLPLLFSGIVFSTLLSGRANISGIMAINLLGAIVGGLLEYNSMYFGFQALYPMAIVCYVLAFVSGFLFLNRRLGLFGRGLGDHRVGEPLDSSGHRA
jgi:spermidine synthase